MSSKLLTAAAVLCAAAATAIAAAAPAPPPAYDFSGAWNSSRGRLAIKQKPPNKNNVIELAGSYAEPVVGSIFATVTNRTADGYWLQRDSARQCSTKNRGARYWGKIQFVASPDGKSFTGYFSYCDDGFDAPDSGKWTGKRP